jgi:hypothetical protein
MARLWSLRLLIHVVPINVDWCWGLRPLLWWPVTKRHDGVFCSQSVTSVSFFGVSIHAYTGLHTCLHVELYLDRGSWARSLFASGATDYGHQSNDSQEKLGRFCVSARQTVGRHCPLLQQQFALSDKLNLVQCLRLAVALDVPTASFGRKARADDLLVFLRLWEDFCFLRRYFNLCR